MVGFYEWGNMGSSQLLEMTAVLNVHCVMQDVAAVDEDLLAHEEHLKYRYRQFLQTKEALEKAEGSLTDFAKVSCPRHPCRHDPLSQYLNLCLTRPYEHVAHTLFDRHMSSSQQEIG